MPNPEAAMSAYYVYDNHHRDRGRIHRAKCPHCNNGRGRGRVTSGAYDRWIGFATREEAVLEAAALQRADMKECGTCLP